MSRPPRLLAIAAMSENRVIGVEGRLPWRLPGDLARFKALTMGHHLLMGRKTFDSIGRALPGRTTIVLTRQLNYRPPAGVLVAHDLAAAIELGGDAQIFVAGGADIYRLALPYLDRIYLTLVHAELAGDVCFPDIDPLEWALSSAEEGEAPVGTLPHTFCVYDRVARNGEGGR